MRLLCIVGENSFNWKCMLSCSTERISHVTVVRVGFPADRAYLRGVHLVYHVVDARVYVVHKLRFANIACKPS